MNSNGPLLAVNEVSQNADLLEVWSGKAALILLMAHPSLSFYEMQEQYPERPPSGKPLLAALVCLETLAKADELAAVHLARPVAVLVCQLDRQLSLQRRCIIALRYLPICKYSLRS